MEVRPAAPGRPTGALLCRISRDRQAPPGKSQGRSRRMQARRTKPDAPGPPSTGFRPARSGPHALPCPYALIPPTLRSGTFGQARLGPRKNRAQSRSGRSCPGCIQAAGRRGRAFANERSKPSAMKPPSSPPGRRSSLRGGARCRCADAGARLSARSVGHDPIRVADHVVRRGPPSDDLGIAVPRGGGVLLADRPSREQPDARASPEKVRAADPPGLAARACRTRCSCDASENARHQKVRRAPRPLREGGGGIG